MPAPGAAPSTPAGAVPGPGPRWLVVEGALRDDGGLRVALDLARRWQDAGARVRFLVLGPVRPGTAVLAADPRLDTRCGSARVHRSWSAAPAVVVTLLRHTRRADVVVSGSEVGYELLLGWAAARATRTPFAVLVHRSLPRAVAGWTPAALRPALAWVHSRVDLALCASPDLVQELVEAGLPRERIHCLDRAHHLDPARAAHEAATVLARLPGEVSRRS